MSDGLKQSFLIAAGGGLLVMAVIVLARRRLISLRYALGWTIISLIGMLGGLLTFFVEPVAEVFGMSPTGVLLAGATFVLLTIALQLSVSVSGLQGHLRDTAEAHALLACRAKGGRRNDIRPVTERRSGMLIVMPAWNEAASVGSAVNEVRSLGYDVVVVDDGSSDMTGREAERAGASTIRLPVNLGVGAALRCGFRYAVEQGYDAVVQVDADGQHPPGSIGSLCTEATATGAHLVTGSRFATGDPGMHVGRLRRAVMSMLARSASRATATRITDATSGFRLIREPLLSQFARTFPAHYLGDTYEALVSAGRAGYVIREVSVVMRDRAHGQSSASTLAAMQFTLRAAIIVCTGLRFPIELAEQAPLEAVVNASG